MKKNPEQSYCSKCQHYWTKGLGYKFKHWCCEYGKPAKKAMGRCKLEGKRREEWVMWMPEKEKQ